MMIDNFTLMTHRIWNRAIDASFNMEARRIDITLVCHLCTYYMCVFGCNPSPIGRIHYLCFLMIAMNLLGARICQSPPTISGISQILFLWYHARYYFCGIAPDTLFGFVLPNELTIVFVNVFKECLEFLSSLSNVSS